MDHKKPPTTIQYYNVIVVGIGNYTIKKKHFCSTEIRFFWINDQFILGEFDVQ